MVEGDNGDCVIHTISILPRPQPTSETGFLGCARLGTAAARQPAVNLRPLEGPPVRGPATPAARRLWGPRPGRVAAALRSEAPGATPTGCAVTVPKAAAGGAYKRSLPTAPARAAQTGSRPQPRSQPAASQPHSAPARPHA